MKLSNFDEPLLLSGTKCYKTFEEKILLKKADIVSLIKNQIFPNY